MDIGDGQHSRESVMFIVALLALIQPEPATPFVIESRTFGNRGRTNEVMPYAITPTEIIFRPTPLVFILRFRAGGEVNVRLNGDEGVATRDFLSWSGASQYQMWNESNRTFHAWKPDPNWGSLVALRGARALFSNGKVWQVWDGSHLQVLCISPPEVNDTSLDLESVTWDGHKLAVGSRNRDLYVAQGGRLRKVASMTVPIDWTSRGLLASKVKAVLDLRTEQLTTASKSEALWDGSRWVDLPPSPYAVTRILGEMNGWEFGFAPTEWPQSSAGSVGREPSRIVKRSTARRTPWVPVELPLRAGYALLDVVANFEFGEMWALCAPYDVSDGPPPLPEVIRFQVAKT